MAACLFINESTNFVPVVWWVGSVKFRDVDRGVVRRWEGENKSMSQPMRQIVVGGILYRWRFDGVLVVIPGDRSGPQLYVDWGWRDWLEPGESAPEPRVVTPQFVAAAIRFAVSQGWPPTDGGRPMRLGFQAGNFVQGESN